jgi:hypothetical protein
MPSFSMHLGLFTLSQHILLLSPCIIIFPNCDSPNISKRLHLWAHSASSCRRLTLLLFTDLNHALIFHAPCLFTLSQHILLLSPCIIQYPNCDSPNISKRLPLRAHSANSCRRLIMVIITIPPLLNINTFC